MFERILKKIFGPNKEADNNQRMEVDIELNNLINNQNIVNYIKSLRIDWLGHIIRMD